MKTCDCDGKGKPCDSCGARCCVDVQDAPHREDVIQGGWADNGAALVCLLCWDQRLISAMIHIAQGE
jgi:hypothetical protein